MTVLYPDAAALAKLYCLEPGSERAAEIVARYAPPFAFSHWQAALARRAGLRVVT